MDISYLGHSSFKIKTKTATIITDPFDAAVVGLKFAPNEAEIITISHDHPDHNFSSKINGIKKIISGPGEYEINGVSIIGLASFHDREKGASRGKNTIYVIEADGLRIAHLGDLGHELSDDLVDQMGDIDILLIPVGGEFTIGPKEASEVVSKIEPFFVIPMHYRVAGMSSQFEKLEPVETFLKESGIATENLPKFSVKKDDILEDQNTKVVVLSTKQ